ncbi:hypothetical protein [Bacillus horti]|uniref:Alkaline phosphatase family protein n=1 Tax=Caldalkalibacillus horti TaxID=77523 RepID=A0ABT9W4W2_9BACI|nr:hypothetical protein [Bacillus horti]MDQ0168288.1 hypothetical protein [Bacillus horti]
MSQPFKRLYRSCKLWKVTLANLVLLVVMVLFSPYSLALSESPINIELVQQESFERSQIHSSSKDNHLLLILLPGLSMENMDLLTPWLPDKILEHGQLGAMTLRTASGLNNQHTLVTLSTGQYERLVGGWNAFHINEQLEDGLTAGQSYTQRSGRNPMGPIVHPLLYKWQNEWEEEQNYRQQPEWLGELLQEQGVYTVAFGNSDIGETKKRRAPMLVMNKEGQAQGLVSKEILQFTPSFPTGYRSDWGKLQEAIDRVWQEHSSTFTVVELGDIERMNSMFKEMEKNHFQEVMQQWCFELGQWLQALLNKEAIQPSIMLVSPWVSAEAQEGGRLLAPILFWEQEQPSGLLTSITTKQTGIVTNLDMAPTILAKFNVQKPLGMVGQPIESISAKRSSDSLVQSLEKLQESGKLSQPFDAGEELHSEKIYINDWKSDLSYMFTIYDKRRSVITTFLTTVILTLLASTAYWWFYRYAHGAKVLQWVVGAILLSPLFFLWFTPLIQYMNEHLWISILFASALCTSFILYRLLSPSICMAAICLLNATALGWDIVQGSEWMKRSFLGYDAIIGARFYGIGNEYAGILLGASIMGVTSLYAGLSKRLERRLEKKWIYLILTSVGYLILLFLVGAPSFGTNAGATLAFLITFPVAQLLLFQYRVKLKQIMIIGSCFLGGFVLFIFMHLQGEHTHVNTLLQALLQGEWGILFEMINRKWSMNMKLIKVSLWGKVFVTSLFVMLFFFFRDRKTEEDKGEQEIWLNGFRAIILGAILLLLINDSGIVAAATTMLYVTFPLIYLKLNEKLEGMQQKE